MEEWISAIERNKNKPKLSAGEKITGDRLDSLFGGNISLLTPILVWWQSGGVRSVASALAHFQIGKHQELFPDASPLLPVDTQGSSHAFAARLAAIGY
jgi:hypothetical protein